jgi:hypothetical protein
MGAESSAAPSWRHQERVAAVGPERTPHVQPRTRGLSDSKPRESGLGAQKSGTARRGILVCGLPGRQGVGYGLHFKGPLEGGRRLAWATGM